MSFIFQGFQAEFSALQNDQSLILGDDEFEEGAWWDEGESGGEGEEITGQASRP